MTLSLATPSSCSEIPSRLKGIETIEDVLNLFFCYRSEIPSRLKGIETFTQLSVSTSCGLCSEIPSRLKGIETAFAPPVPSVCAPSSEIPSRLKGIETCDMRQFANFNSISSFGNTFPFEGN